MPEEHDEEVAAAGQADVADSQPSSDKIVKELIPSPLRNLRQRQPDARRVRLGRNGATNERGRTEATGDEVEQAQDTNRQTALAVQDLVKRVNLARQDTVLRRTMRQHGGSSLPSSLKGMVAAVPKRTPSRSVSPRRKSEGGESQGALRIRGRSTSPNPAAHDHALAKGMSHEGPRAAGGRTRVRGNPLPKGVMSPLRSMGDHDMEVDRLNLCVADSLQVRLYHALQSSHK
jgi:hypothetical protein